MIGFFSMRYQEVKGHWPLMKPKKRHDADTQSNQSESEITAVEGGKIAVTEKSAEVAT